MIEVLNPVQKERAAQQLARYKRSPLLFAERMWGLTPQPVKPEYLTRWLEVRLATGDEWRELAAQVDASWFGDWIEATGAWQWHNFVPGQHLTWQQTLVLLGIEKAANGQAPKHISIASGHGIGKSSVTSIVVLWFLYCFRRAIVPCTAPSRGQMHDVLWKELSIWIDRMPPAVRGAYDWQAGYVRMLADPEKWYARARTSTKENTEAIAGVHSDNVLIAVDEASGVPEQVYNAAEGSLTSKNVWILLISNPTRTSGYFYDTHHRYKSDWQTFRFSSIDSPIVDPTYVERQRKRHGETSEEYGIRVLGVFPNEGVMDDTGFLQLIPAERINVQPRIMGEVPFVGRRVMGVDPSGEGKDTATWVVRDSMHIAVLHTMQTTNSKQIASHTILLAQRLKIRPEDIAIGALGVGTNVARDIMIATHDMPGGSWNVYSVLEGNSPAYEEELYPEFFERLPVEMDLDGKDLYLNIRALMGFRLRAFFMGGGTIVDDNTKDSTFKHEVLSMRYTRVGTGNKIRMMSKKEMTKLRIKSPNIYDAAALSCLRTIDTERDSRYGDEDTSVFDRHKPL